MGPDSGPKLPNRTEPCPDSGPKLVAQNGEHRGLEPCPDSGPKWPKSGECSGEGVGGFGAKVKFNRVPNQVLEIIPGASGTSQVRFNRALKNVPENALRGCRARSCSARFLTSFWRMSWGAKPNQVQQVQQGF